MSRSFLKRIGSAAVSLLLAAGLAIGLPQAKVSAATTFTDTANHWAADFINKWSAYGVIVGDSKNDAGPFNPNRAMTVAELSSVMANLMGYTDKAKNQFTDVPKGAWYENAILKMAQARLLPIAGSVTPDRQVTRGEVFVIFAKAFELRPVAGTTTFLDDAAIPASQKGYINALQKDGALAGIPSGDGFVVSAAKTLTRAELMSTFDQIAGDLLNKAGTYTKGSAKNLVINSTSVTLNGATVGKNLFIAEGVENGDVYLNSVKVSGKIYVKGGGANSVHLTNTTAKGVSVHREGVSLKLTNSSVATVEANASFAIVNSGDTAAPNIVVNTSGVTLALTGNIGTVSVASSVKDVRLEGTAKIAAVEGAVTASESIAVAETKPAPTTAPAATPAPSASSSTGGGGDGYVPPAATPTPAPEPAWQTLAASEYKLTATKLAGVTFIVVKLSDTSVTSAANVQFLLNGKAYASAKVGDEFRVAAIGDFTAVTAAGAVAVQVKR